MILLAGPKGHGGLELGGNWSVVILLLFFKARLGNGLLFGRVKVDARPVLCSKVLVLPIDRGGIDKAKKGIQKTLVGTRTWVVVDNESFHMAYG